MIKLADYLEAWLDKNDVDLHTTYDYVNRSVDYVMYSRRTGHAWAIPTLYESELFKHQHEIAQWFSAYVKRGLVALHDGFVYISSAETASYVTLRDFIKRQDARHDK